MASAIAGTKERQPIDRARADADTAPRDVGISVGTAGQNGGKSRAILLAARIDVALASA